MEAADQEQPGETGKQEREEWPAAKTPPEYLAATKSQSGPAYYQQQKNCDEGKKSQHGVPRD